MPDLRVSLWYVLSFTVWVPGFGTVGNTAKLTVTPVSHNVDRVLGIKDKYLLLLST